VSDVILAETRDVAPGWHDMHAHVYHGDPCPTPSLSASCAKMIISESLLHAWADHPRNPRNRDMSASRTRDIGSAVHAAVFGGAGLSIIDAESFRSKEAKTARDNAYVAGLIPILACDTARIAAMANIARERFNDLYGGPYHAERVAIWRCPRTSGWRRGMLDTSAKAAPIIVDYKTTEASVSDEACVRRIFDNGLHIQAAAYEEAMGALNPEWAGRVRFFFQWQEQVYPYALSRPIEMGEAAMSLGRGQWQVAGALWDAAVKRNKFPGYGGSPLEASPPPWEMSRWEDRMMNDETLNGTNA
jgi:hypothetical protein